MAIDEFDRPARPCSADYLHQRARATVADHDLERVVRGFLKAGESVTTQHYIAER